MKKILWLPAWYPNKIDPLSGDFIQRHARAVALYHHVHVICVIRDRDGKITRGTRQENKISGNLSENIIYYHTPVVSVAFIDKLISYARYRLIYRRAVRNYIDNEGQPYCSHVHVGERNGWVAVWLKNKFGVPFFVSEHWTVYLPGARPGFPDFPWYFKLLWRRMIKESQGISVVSRYLGESMKNYYKGIRFTVIPNVVDTSIFYPIEKPTGNTVHFIHISTLGYQKYPEAILNAFALVKKENPGFTLSIIGPAKKELIALSQSLGLGDNVGFKTEMPQPELAVHVQQSQALVMYSRYETFGCVVIEANSCGLPAIVSDIPVFHEIIKEGVNGYFVPANDPQALAKKILWFMENLPSANPELISSTTREKYNDHYVGNLFNQLYEAVIN